MAKLKELFVKKNQIDLYKALIINTPRLLTSFNKARLFIHPRKEVIRPRKVRLGQIGTSRISQSDTFVHINVLCFQ
jgi:hypothetical protein